MNLKNPLIFLLTSLLIQQAIAAECTPQQVDQALRSVTQGKGLITIKKKDSTQSGSCFVSELDDFGITIVASSGKEQDRLDCEVVLFADIEMTNDWQLEHIKATSLNSIQVSVNSGAEISGNKDLFIKPVYNEFKTDKNGHRIVAKKAAMVFLVWINKRHTAGTLTIKSLTFNQNDCDNLRAGFETVISQKENAAMNSF